jgi:hypothetical protein
MVRADIDKTAGSNPFAEYNTSDQLVGFVLLSFLEFDKHCDEGRPKCQGREAELTRASEI